MNAPAPATTAAAAPTIRAIVATVCEHFQIRRVDLMSQRRSSEVVRPRQIVMWLARSLTAASLPEIGRRLGGRDHTTVMHGVRMIERLYETDPSIRSAVEAIAMALGVLVRSGRPVELMHEEADPLETALTIAMVPGAAAGTSAEAIEAMARCLVGYAMSLGALRIEGAEPDPELLPIEAATPPDDRRRTEAVLRTLATAWRAFETARFSRGEASALEGLSKAVKAAISTLPEEA